MNDVSKDGASRQCRKLCHLLNATAAAEVKGEGKKERVRDLSGNGL